MRPPARKRLARIAAALLLAILIAGGGLYWRDLLRFFVPASVLWGRWELVSVDGRAWAGGARRVVVEYAIGGTKTTCSDAGGGSVQRQESVYSVSGERIFHHDAAGEMKPHPSRFWFEEDGTLVVGSAAGILARYRRLEADAE
jgi:hypothetical protein